MLRQWLYDMRRFREHLLSIAPYASARDEFEGRARIYLDANENSYAAAWAEEESFRYPDPHHKVLRDALASYLGVTSDEILCGNGSDEIIDWLIRVTCEPYEDAILTIEPSYGVYETYARIHGAAVQKVCLEEDFTLPPQAVQRAITPHTRLLFLCSPNNPTGNTFSAEAIEPILMASDGWVVIDEAYGDFSENPAFWLHRRSEYPNLILLRTFSKAWGLAGWRVGYAVAPTEVVSLFYRTKLPYNLSMPAQHAALEALSRRQVLQSVLAQIRSERARLAQALLEVPLVKQVFPSQANFLLVRFVHSAHRIYEALLGYGIVTRYRGNLPLCEETIRITIGTPEENDTLLSALCAISSSIVTEPS